MDDTAARAARAAQAGRLKGTFFCNLTTLVHFFSSRPSYFFAVVSSKVSPRSSSVRNAAAVLGRLLETK